MVSITQKLKKPIKKQKKKQKKNGFFVHPERNRVKTIICLAVLWIWIFNDNSDNKTVPIQDLRSTLTTLKISEKIYIFLMIKR